MKFEVISAAKFKPPPDMSDPWKIVSDKVALTARTLVSRDKYRLKYVIFTQ